MTDAIPSPVQSAHDPDVCGLDGPGISPTCPGCIAEGRVGSAVAAEVNRICDLFQDADGRAKAAATVADRETALAEREEAMGVFWAAGEGLADLLLLLLRYAAKHRAEELKAYLVDLLRPELEPIIDALARMEARR